MIADNANALVRDGCIPLWLQACISGQKGMEGIWRRLEIIISYLSLGGDDLTINILGENTQNSLGVTSNVRINITNSSLTALKS
jgi:hypothetical protein